MDGLRRPDPVSFDGNVAENWRKFELEYDIYIECSFAEKTSKQKAMILLNLAGSEAMERERAFQYLPEIHGDEGTVQRTEESRYDPNTLKRKFKELCSPLKNFIVERHIFNSRVQRQNEPINEFLSDLRIKASTCEYGNLVDELIRDRLVTGIINDNVRKQLLKEHELSLHKAVRLCQLNELSEAHANSLADTSAAVLKKEADALRMNTCSNCGFAHNDAPESCRAQGKLCNFCKRPGHFQAMCRIKKRQENTQPTIERDSQQGSYSSAGRGRATWRGGSGAPRWRDRPDKREYARNRPPTPRNRRVYTVDDDNHSDDTDQEVHTVTRGVSSYHISSVDVDTVGDEMSELNKTVRVNNRNLLLKVDTGAKCNVISRSSLTALGVGHEINCNETANLVSYSGDTIPTVGAVQLKMRYLGKYHRLKFIVIENKAKSLIGFKDSVRLGMVQINSLELDQTRGKKAVSIFTEYAQLFDEKTIGRFPVEYHVQLDPEVAPVVRPPRKVPVARYEKVKHELRRMTEMGVITPVDEETEWVSGMVAADKKGNEVRICIDPRYLNEALLRPHYPMRTVDDVLSRVPEGKVFAVFDMKSGFWHIPLSEQSSYLSTFNTPFGRYRYLRMPYGIKTGSEVFQQAMDKMFTGYPCEIIVDDMLIVGEDDADLECKVRQVLDRCRELNVRLNRSKCKKIMNEVTYVGHQFTDRGVKPDPEKIRAISMMQAPLNVKELQRFIGMVNYLSKFIPQFSETTAPLRELLHKENGWSWLTPQEAFNKLKGALVKPLQYFDVSRSTVISCDASQNGLGAAILQCDRPVAYASRALTKTEKRYSQIEKELLAIVFSCTKFHDYIYGKTIKVETDHKPLIQIMRKSIDRAPKRLQDMIMVLSKYDLHVTYKKGEELFIADTLSRSYLDEVPSAQEQIRYEVMSVIQVSEQRLEALRDATKSDRVLTKLANVIINGWRDKFKSVALELRPYYNIRDELSIDDGVIVRGHRVVVPESLQELYIDLLHTGHPNAEATKRRAIDTVYWPEISADIERRVSECSVCNSCRHKQRKEPMLMREIPSRPWEIVASDLFHWHDQWYLVLVNSYSGWMEMNSLNTLTSKEVINKMRPHFARWGTPRVLQSDNGTQYISREFAEFAATWGFNHVTNSPTYSQSNGLAENGVKIAKSILDKAWRSGADPLMCLQYQRNTPRDNVIGSPAERLQSRRLQTQLPMTQAVLKPGHDNETVSETLRARLRLQQVRPEDILFANAGAPQDMTINHNYVVQCYLCNIT